MIAAPRVQLTAAVSPPIQAPNSSPPVRRSSPGPPAGKAPRPAHRRRHRQRHRGPAGWMQRARPRSSATAARRRDQHVQREVMKPSWDAQTAIRAHSQDLQWPEAGVQSALARRGLRPPSARAAFLAAMAAMVQGSGHSRDFLAEIDARELSPCGSLLLPWALLRGQSWGCGPAWGGVFGSLEGCFGELGRWRTDPGPGQAGARMAQRRRLKAMAASSTWAWALVRPM